MAGAPLPAQRAQAEQIPNAQPILKIPSIPADLQIPTTHDFPQVDADYCLLVRGDVRIFDQMLGFESDQEALHLTRQLAGGVHEDLF